MAGKGKTRHGCRLCRLRVMIGVPRAISFDLQTALRSDDEAVLCKGCVGRRCRQRTAHSGSRLLSSSASVTGAVARQATAASAAALSPACLPRCLASRAPIELYVRRIFSIQFYEKLSNQPLGYYCRKMSFFLRSFLPLSSTSGLCVCTPVFLSTRLLLLSCHGSSLCACVQRPISVRSAC